MPSSIKFRGAIAAIFEVSIPIIVQALKTIPTAMFARAISYTIGLLLNSLWKRDGQKCGKSPVF